MSIYKEFILYLFFFLFVINVALFGVIEDINSIDGEMLPKIQKWREHYKAEPDETLVAIGVDRVIVHPSYIPFQIQNIYSHRESLTQITNELTEEQRYLLYNLFTKKGPLELIESATPKVIRSLQERSVRTMGLTAYLTGSVGSIECNEAWIATLLREHYQINFESAFKGFEDIELKEEEPYRGHFPRYYKGILHANGRGEKGSKGHTLISFLKYARYTPKIVFYIDDIPDHLTSMEAQLKQYSPSIHFIGLKYRYREFCNRDKLVSSEAFKKAWSTLAEEVKSINQ